AGFQFIGITALAVFFFVLIVYWSKKATPLKEFLFQAATVSLTGLAVYLVGWKIHFLLLPNPGFGDAFYRNSGRFLPLLSERHRQMSRAKASLPTPHPAASLAWSWLFMTKPLF